MEIDANMNLGSVNGPSSAKRVASVIVPTPQDASFASSTALESALKSLPDVRPEAVANAKALIADPSYPSAGTINRMAGFLAGQLQSGFE
jgi:hypothetical protein